MAKQDEQVPFLKAYKAADYAAKYSGSLSKPAFGRLSDLPGYEGVLWGGQLSWGLGRNFSKMYTNYCLAYGSAKGYVPSRPGMGVAAQVQEARHLGFIPADMPPMEASDWRAVLENIPSPDTEGGVGLSVGALLDMLSGFADIAHDRHKSEKVAKLRDTMLYVAEESPKYAKYKPITKALENAATAHGESFYSLILKAREASATPTAAVA
jgi:hypothetical protein